MREYKRQETNRYMKTIYTKMSEDNIDRAQIRAAGEILRKGGLVAFPTETVYGLGGDAFNPESSRKIYAAKGRPSDNPLIVHICRIEDLEKVALQVTPEALRLAEAFWPGPLTMIMKRTDVIPNEVSAGLDTVAIRFPSHPVAQEIIRAANTPLAAPSANLSGSPSPTTARHVLNDMDGKIDAVLDGGASEVGVESTVITLAAGVPRVLRPGGVTVEELRGVLGEVEVDDAVLHQLKEGVAAASPGMKYKHYAPKANVILLKGADDEYIEYVNARAGDDVCALCCDEDLLSLKVKTVSLGRRGDYLTHARHLFDCLRGIDENKTVLTVYSRLPSTEGVGLAVYNRLIRAAGFEVIDLEKV